MRSEAIQKQLQMPFLTVATALFKLTAQLDNTASCQ